MANRSRGINLFKRPLAILWTNVVDYWDAVLVVALSITSVFLRPQLSEDARTILYIAMAGVAAIVLVRRLYPALSNNLHYLRAQLGWRANRAPKRYVRALFDEYAESFDDHMLWELSYNVPNLLRGIVGARDEAGVPVVVDLGCGTGMCGPLFAPFAEELIGVDLSGEMLDRAAERNCYDQLIESDLMDFLSLYENEFDLCLAADVFVYFGELKPLFAAVRRSMIDGGHLAFSVEAAEDGEANNWRLTKTGRYAHPKPYVEDAAKWAGFEVVDVGHEILRKQQDQPVTGDVWLLRKPDTGRPRNERTEEDAEE